MLPQSLRRLTRRQRRAARLSELNEAECYARCHGQRDTDVRIVKLEPRRPRFLARMSGEDVRRLFEQRLDAREGHPGDGTPGAPA